MIPVQYDIQHYRGDELTRRFKFTRDGEVQDISGWPISAQVRKGLELNSPLVLEFTTHQTTELGILDIYLPPEATANLKAGEYFYDIQIGPRTYIAGTFELLADVSRAA